jgi:hypothetical protein
MNVPATTPGRSLMIKNLLPGLPERGKIKIGVKGKAVQSRKGTTFQPPEKLDHFVVTTLERGPDGNFVRDPAIHGMIGDTPRRIPITLLYNDIDLNFQSRYACYQGRRLWCAGDGEAAIRQLPNGPQTVSCTCERIDFDYKGSDKCKFNGTLSVMIRGAGGLGGVWKFRTTSVNTVRNLTGSLQLIKAASGGVLAGLDLDLVLTPKAAMLPDGSQQTVYVVSVEFAGTLDELQQISYERALKDARHIERIAHVEDEARRLLAPPQSGKGVFQDDDGDDVVDELYPEQAAAALAGPAPKRPETAADLPNTVGGETAADDPEGYDLVDPYGEVIGSYTAAWWTGEFHNCLTHRFRRWTEDERRTFVANNLDTAEAIEKEDPPIEGYSFEKFVLRCLEEHGIDVASLGEHAAGAVQEPGTGETEAEAEAGEVAEAEQPAAPTEKQVNAYFEQVSRQVPGFEAIAELRSFWSTVKEQPAWAAMTDVQRRDLEALKEEKRTDLLRAQKDGKF